jgi:adenylate cyclase
MYGELHPHGGGDSIPLRKKSLLVGRRESCDIVLRFSNVSAHHCQLLLVGGYWYVKDLNSRNGTKVNGVRVREKRLDPGDTLSIAKHVYDIKYSPIDNGAVGPPPPDVSDYDVFNRSLLERAGLDKGRSSSQSIPSHPEPTDSGRYDLLEESFNEEIEQLRRGEKPD